MWVLTTLVKVSNFTNEVYDLHYVSSIIAEAIICSEFWTHFEVTDKPKSTRKYLFDSSPTILIFKIFLPRLLNH